MVGFGGFERYEGTGVCLLLGPVVKPIARGRGIGHALWRVMLRDAVEAGAREILWAVVGSRNGRAERILRAAGFARGDVQAVYRLEPFRHIPAAEGPVDRARARRAADLDAVAALVERRQRSRHDAHEQRGERDGDNRHRHGRIVVRRVAKQDPAYGINTIFP